jgi:hypothetical protein
MPKKEPLKFKTLEDALHYCNIHDNSQIVAWSQAYNPAKITPNIDDVFNGKAFWTVHMRRIIPQSMGKCKWSVITGD